MNDINVQEELCLRSCPVDPATNTCSFTCASEGVVVELWSQEFDVNNRAINTLLDWHFIPSGTLTQSVVFD